MATVGLPSLALTIGSVLAGAMAGLSLVAVPVVFDAARAADQSCIQWPGLSVQGYLLLLTLAVATLMMLLPWSIEAAARAPGMTHLARFGPRPETDGIASRREQVHVADFNTYLTSSRSARTQRVVGW